MNGRWMAVAVVVVGIAPAAAVGLVLGAVVAVATERVRAAIDVPWIGERECVE